MTDEPQGYAWYWSIDIPGLTEAEAARVTELCDAEGIGEVGCIPGDPLQVLTLHLDSASVEALSRALAMADGGPVEAGLLETCRDWLEWRTGSAQSTGR